MYYAIADPICSFTPFCLPQFLAEPVSSDGEEHMEDILGIINSHFGQIA